MIATRGIVIFAHLIFSAIRRRSLGANHVYAEPSHTQYFMGLATGRTALPTPGWSFPPASSRAVRSTRQSLKNASNMAADGEAMESCVGGFASASNACRHRLERVWGIPPDRVVFFGSSATNVPLG
jgi:hypothetical protein